MTVAEVAKETAITVLKMLNGNTSWHTNVLVGTMETDGAIVELRTYVGRVVGYITVDGSDDLGWVLKMHSVGISAKKHADFLIDVHGAVQQMQWLLDSDLCECQHCDRELLDGLVLSLHCDRDESRWWIMADWCEENDREVLAKHLRLTHPQPVLR